MNMKTALIQSLGLATALALAGCGDDPPPAPPAAPVDSAPTFWANVAPILNAKCVGCHQSGRHRPLSRSTTTWTPAGRR